MVGGEEPTRGGVEYLSLLRVAEAFEVDDARGRGDPRKTPRAAAPSTGRLRRRAHGCPQTRRAIPAKVALATLPVVANGCASVWGGRNEAKGWVHETEKVGGV